MARGKIVLPDITFENSGAFERIISIPERVVKILTAGKFIVDEVCEGRARMMPGEISIIMYKVTLPKGWRTKIQSGKKFLVDEKGHWRAEIYKTMYGDPVKTDFFCRYSVLSGNDLNRFTFNPLPDLEREKRIRAVVLDRMCVSKEDPCVVINGIMRTDASFSTRLLNDATPDEFLKALKKRNMPPEADLCSWLAETYPDWQNPFAYWENS